MSTPSLRSEQQMHLEAENAVRSRYLGMFLAFKVIALARPNARFFFPAYCYARWLDDLIDESSSNESLAVFASHSRLIEDYRAGLSLHPSLDDPMAAMLVLLLEADRDHFGGELAEAIRETFWTFEFDLSRRWIWYDQREIDEYSERMGMSFIRAIACLLQIDVDVSAGDLRAVSRAGCQTFMMRDFADDFEVGYINAPSRFRGCPDAQALQEAWFSERKVALSGDYALAFYALARSSRLSRLAALLFLLPRFRLFQKIVHEPQPIGSECGIGPADRAWCLWTTFRACIPRRGAPALLALGRSLEAGGS